MDPLFKVREAFGKGLLPEAAHAAVASRFPLVVSGIDRIERASGLQYPVAYVEPSAVVSAPDPSSMARGILFARTVPLVLGGDVRVVVQVSAPLVAYGLKGTIHAVLAHEFLHFLELVHRASRMGMLSDEVTGSVFESAHADRGRLFEPGAVFRDRTLVSHVTKRFPAGFRDARLERKTIDLWIGGGLPRTAVQLDSNTARLPAGAISRMRLGDGLAERLAGMAEKSLRMQGRRAGAPG